jgi:hypothetical protein
VGVVVTRIACSHLLALLILLMSSGQLCAATLEADKVDLLYHQYDGGGMKIDGPSVLVRKNVGNQVSLTGQYYVDTVSAASIDVLANASEYEEERTEYSGGIDYLHDKTTMSLGYTNSTENDFVADSIHFGISQDFFGDLTNISLGFSQGWDEIGKRDNDTFKEEADRRHYRFGLSQILTKNWLVGINFETITDEGSLNNPYRVYRFFDSNALGDKKHDKAEEEYPETRTSNAVSLRTQYYLPYRASVQADVRFFSDTWGIRATQWGLGYNHAIQDAWIVETHIRHYQQDKADFYADIFPYKDFQTHMARDKELSTYTNNSFGLGVSYEIGRGVIPLIDRFQFSLLMDFMKFDYEDFRNELDPSPAGQEEFYSFDATVTRASFIFEY